MQRQERKPETGQGLARSIVELYTMHGANLHRYLLLTGSRPADADDLVQEAFLRLYQYLRDGKQLEEPKAWLIRVLQNLRTDRARIESRYGALIGAAIRHGQAKLSSRDASPERAMIDQERFSQLRQAIEGLPERQRRYVLLRSEGMTLRMIAELHGVTVQSVAETCARAIERLGRITRE